MKRSIFCALAIALPVAAFGQSTAAQPETSKNRDASYLKALDDLDVVDADGNIIGEIDEVLIDTNGQPVAFVIEVGGFLGLGDREAQVPINALTFDGAVYVSKMTRTQIENLPEWDDRAD